MVEYIDRANLIARIKYYVTHTPKDKGEHYAYSVMLNEILNRPAADVAPVVHGRWVDRIVDENEVIQPWMQRYYCSECLEGGSQSWFKFCPNCGAKMDEEETT